MRGETIYHLTKVVEGRPNRIKHSHCIWAVFWNSFSCKLFWLPAWRLLMLAHLKGRLFEKVNWEWKRFESELIEWRRGAISSLEAHLRLMYGALEVIQYGWCISSASPLSSALNSSPPLRQPIMQCSFCSLIPLTVSLAAPCHGGTN